MNLFKDQERLCRELGYTRGLLISLAYQALLLSGIRGRGREACRLADEALTIAIRCGFRQVALQVKDIRDSVHNAE